MNAGVFTRMKRVTFVEGQETPTPDVGFVACGDNTWFPLEVTGASIADKLDKIAEIFYRVKSAQFSENNITGSGFASGVTGGTIYPRVMHSDSGGGLSDNYLMSGYYTLDEPPSEVHANAVPYFGEQYTEDYIPGPGFTDSGIFRDIGDNERGMWLPTIDVYSPRWNSPAELLSGGSVFNAFSWYSNSATGTIVQPSIPIPWISQFYDPDTIYESLELTVAFSGRIGVIYAGAVGDLFHDGNKFFLEMLCSGSSSVFFFTSGPVEAGYSSTTAKYTMSLSAGGLSCVLCSTDSTLAGSLTHTATEWWPYAKRADPPAVWDANTGEKLPDAVVFAAFDRDDQQDQIFHLI